MLLTLINKRILILWRSKKKTILKIVKLLELAKVKSTNLALFVDVYA